MHKCIGKLAPVLYISDNLLNSNTHKTCGLNGRQGVGLFFLAIQLTAFFCSRLNNGEFICRN